MKPSSYLAAALLIILALALCACSHRDAPDSGTGESGTEVGTEAGTEAGTVGSAGSETMTEEEAKLEALHILTPTVGSHEFRPKDDIVYDDCLAEGSMFIEPYDENYLDDYNNRPGAGGGSKNDTEEKDDTRRKYIWNYVDNTEPEILCRIDGCEHKDLRCPAHNVSVLFSFDDRTTGDRIIYYLVNISLKNVKIGGHSIDLSAELGKYCTNWRDKLTQEISVLFEYDMTTGVRRAVMLGYPWLRGEFYYDGKIYVNDNVSQQDLKTLLLWSVDTQTGETKYFNEENKDITEGVYFTGINDGKLYAISQSGILFRMQPDFSGCEEMCALFDAERAKEYYESRYFISLSLFDDEYMYLRFNEDTKNYPGRDSLYRYKLTGELPPEVISEEVGKDMVKYGNYIYYTHVGIFAYMYPEGYTDSENIPIYDYASSSLCRYDTKTGREEEVFSLDGIIVCDVRYIDDERIIYCAKLRTGDLDIEDMPDDPELIRKLNDNEMTMYVEYTFSAKTHRFVYFDEQFTPRLPKDA